MARRSARVRVQSSHKIPNARIFSMVAASSLGAAASKRPGVRTFVHDAANVGAGEGILQVRRGGKRIHDSIGKFFREDAREAGAKLLAGDATGGARANR